MAFDPAERLPADRRLDTTSRGCCGCVCFAAASGLFDGEAAAAAGVTSISFVAAWPTRPDHAEEEVEQRRGSLRMKELLRHGAERIPGGRRPTRPALSACPVRSARPVPGVSLSRPGVSPSRPGVSPSVPGSARPVPGQPVPGPACPSRGQPVPSRGSPSRPGQPVRPGVSPSRPGQPVPSRGQPVPSRGQPVPPSRGQPVPSRGQDAWKVIRVLPSVSSSPSRRSRSACTPLTRQPLVEPRSTSAAVGRRADLGVASTHVGVGEDQVALGHPTDAHGLCPARSGCRSTARAGPHATGSSFMRPTIANVPGWAEARPPGRR
jgi:hypothetical protein